MFSLIWAALVSELFAEIVRFLQGSVVIQELDDINVRKYRFEIAAG